MGSKGVPGPSTPQPPSTRALVAFWPVGPRRASANRPVPTAGWARRGYGCDYGGAGAVAHGVGPAPGGVVRLLLAGRGRATDVSTFPARLLVGPGAAAGATTGVRVRLPTGSARLAGVWPGWFLPVGPRRGCVNRPGPHAGWARSGCRCNCRCGCRHLGGGPTPGRTAPGGVPAGPTPAAPVRPAGIRTPPPGSAARPQPSAAAARLNSRARSALLRVSAAARSNSARASADRPRRSSRSPRTLGSRW